VNLIRMSMEMKAEDILHMAIKMKHNKELSRQLLVEFAKANEIELHDERKNYSLVASTISSPISSNSSKMSYKERKEYFVNIESGPYDWICDVRTSSRIKVRPDFELGVDMEWIENEVAVSLTTDQGVWKITTDRNVITFTNENHQISKMKVQLMRFCDKI